VTPEQTTELLKALNQHNWFLVGCGIVWLFGTILQFVVVARIKSAIENKQHFSRVRYEHEIELYHEVWEKLCTCYEKSFLRFTWKANDSNSKVKVDELQKAAQDFFEIIRNKRPFYPVEISEELFKFSGLCSQLDNIHSHLQTGSIQLQNDFLPKLEAVEKEAREQFDKIEKVIRKRLDKFEGLK
jgi:hypothetical protein